MFQKKMAFPKSVLCYKAAVRKENSLSTCLANPWIPRVTPWATWQWQWHRVSLTGAAIQSSPSLSLVTKSTKVSAVIQKNWKMKQNISGFQIEGTSEINMKYPSSGTLSAIKNHVVTLSILRLWGPSFSYVSNYGTRWYNPMWVVTYTKQMSQIACGGYVVLY